MTTWILSHLSTVHPLTLMGEQPTLITPFCVHKRPISIPRLPLSDVQANISTHESISSAADSLLGARRASTRASARDRTTAESDETLGVGKGDPEQSKEAGDGVVGLLQRVAIA